MRALGASERRLCPFGTPPLRRKAGAGCGLDHPKATAAKKTAGTTVNVGNLAIAVLQLGATPAASAPPTTWRSRAEADPDNERIPDRRA